MQRPATPEEALLRGFPAPLAIAIVAGDDGAYNPISLSWTMQVSRDPLLFALAIGSERHTREQLERSRRFVLAYPSTTMSGDTFFYGTRSGRDVDKLAVYGTATLPATEIEGLLLRDAVANFECELENQFETGDHMLYIGRVLAAHVNVDDDVRRLFAIGFNQLGGVIPG